MLCRSIQPFAAQRISPPTTNSESSSLLIGATKSSIRVKYRSVEQRHRSRKKQLRALSDQRVRSLNSYRVVAVAIAIAGDAVQHERWKLKLPTGFHCHDLDRVVTRFEIPGFLAQFIHKRRGTGRRSHSILFPLPRHGSHRLDQIEQRAAT